VCRRRSRWTRSCRAAGAAHGDLGDFEGVGSMRDVERPPHPATVIQPKPAFAFDQKKERPPHPATVQRTEAPFGMPKVPPHSATVQRREVAFGVPKVPPHPATVQRVVVQPKAVQERAPHPATVQRQNAVLGVPAVWLSRPATLVQRSTARSPMGANTSRPTPGERRLEAIAAVRKHSEGKADATICAMWAPGFPSWITGDSTWDHHKCKTTTRGKTLAWLFRNHWMAKFDISCAERHCVWQILESEEWEGKLKELHLNFCALEHQQGSKTEEKLKKNADALNKELRQCLQNGYSYAAHCSKPLEGLSACQDEKLSPNWHGCKKMLEDLGMTDLWNADKWPEKDAALATSSSSRSSSSTSIGSARPISYWKVATGSPSTISASSSSSTSTLSSTTTSSATTSTSISSNSDPTPTQVRDQEEKQKKLQQEQKKLQQEQKKQQQKASQMTRAALSSVPSASSSSSSSTVSSSTTTTSKRS
jgi:hypothetical protein